ncbi:MAG: DNA methyltransferase [Candidatus Paceibacterota bacterium]
MEVKLYCGDCLEIMRTIPDKSIDAVITDPPYGTTAISWDKAIDLNLFWSGINPLIKQNTPVLIFSSQPFTTDLIVSNRDRFKYEIIWKKTQAQGFLNANKCPLRNHENIIVFYEKLPTYNPIKSKIDRDDIGRILNVNAMRSKQYREMNRTTWVETGERYPTDVVEFSNWNGALFGKTKDATKHPTQKPVDLCAYLIETYSNPGDTILDPFMGSGTTGVACAKTGHNFIGIEIDPGYFKIAEKRIYDAQQQMRLF